jgi:hypothetical protein
MDTYDFQEMKELSSTGHIYCEYKKESVSPCPPTILLITGVASTCTNSFPSYVTS